MNYADKTKYPRTTARGEIQDVNKMGSRKPMKLNLGMAPKVIFIMMLDVLATVVSFFLGLWFRYDFSFAEIRPVHMEGFLSAIGLWCVITLLVFWIFRLYNSIWAFVSTPEVFRITGAYVVLGVIGVPVFAGFGSGPAVLFGKTGGYIQGYILCALIVGALSHKFAFSFKNLCLEMLLGVAVCYAFGTIWFMVLTGMNLATSMGYCVIPFLPGDVVKILLAAFLALRLRKPLAAQGFAA